MLSDEEIVGKVQAGICWLDDHIVDWLPEINLEYFDIRSVNNCILGQLASVEGTDYYELRDDIQEDGHCTFDLGFDLTYEMIKGTPDGWERLGEEWVRRIVELREKS